MCERAPERRRAASFSMVGSRLARFAWLVFVGCTALLAAGLVRQSVDPENRALKVPDGVEARRRAELARIVPDDPMLLLACVARGSQALQPADRDRVEALGRQLESRDDVRECRYVEPPDAGVVLLAVALAVDTEPSDTETIDTAPFDTALALVEIAERDAPPTVEVLATGMPLVEGTIARLVAGERTTVVPLLLAVLFVAAWLGYRRLSLAVAVLMPAVTAIAWTGGTVAWLGHRLDPVAALLDPVLLTIGVAASVHFVEAFRRARARGERPERAVSSARASLRRPAFWAATTTMLGLWSLTVNDTPAVVDFGLRAALGVALTHAFTFVLLPVWLRRFGGDGHDAVPVAAVGGAWCRRLASTRGLTLAATGAAIALAASGLATLRTENDPLSVLPPDETVREHHDRLAARLGGVETFHVLVSSDSLATDPSRLLPFLAAVRSSDEVGGLAGPVRRGSDGALAVPMLLRPAGSTARSRRFDAIERTARVLGLDGVVVAGRSVQIARDSVHLMHGLLGSLGLSLLVLTTAMAIGLRSLRLALVAMAPSMLPSLWLYGGLGALGRPLSVATAMIGCTMLGLIVDNTLHLLHHFRDARRAGADHADAVAAALDHCGRAIHVSSVVLMLGFATAATSRLSTTVEFAVLATATIAMAWFGTAVLLPTILMAGGARRDRRGAAPVEEVVHAR